MLRTNYSHLLKLGMLGFTISLVAAPLGCKPAEEEGDDEIGDETATETTGDGDGDTATETGDGDGDTATETGDGDGDTATETGDGDGDCPTHNPIDGAAIGEACTVNGDCASQVCVFYQDAPPAEGTCEDTTANCATRFLGRILDFGTREPVEGVDVKVAQAIAASVNPVGAAALAMATSGADGTFDVVSDEQINSPLGVVGLSSAEGYYLTATGMAAPAEGAFYGPASTIRDIWAVPSDLLTDWSTYLELDPEFADQLPLGDAGGVVGLVRDVATGEPIAGAVVVSTEPDTSGAVIRYLNEAGDDFTTDMTSSQGIFVIVKPGLGEDFGVEVDGAPVDGVTATAGSANGAVFTAILDVP